MCVDVTALGEILIDFTEAGRSESGQALFEQNPGGAPANVLSACAKLGLKTAFLGKVGRDLHGDFLRGVLEGAGINADGLAVTDEAFTTLAFVALQQGERRFSFARKPGADTLLTQAEAAAHLRDSRVFHFGSLSLTHPPSRGATLWAARAAKDRGALISYDPNYRASLWPDEGTAMARMREPLPLVDLVKLSEEETALLTGHADPLRAARALLSTGVSLAVVTLGRRGALAATERCAVQVAGYPPEAVDSTGAGDAFWGGMLCALLAGEADCRAWDAERLIGALRLANAVATLCVGRRGAIPAMPAPTEVEALMAQNPPPEATVLD